MEQYKTNGREINKKYCLFTDKFPIMLPPAPKQTYIDVYLDGDGSSSSQFDQEKRLQADYETEVTAYRSLEILDENIIVLHGFEFTHHQYRIWEVNHKRGSCPNCKNAANRDGECDFIVIGKNYLVVIEVKNLPHDENQDVTTDKEKILKGLFQKSQKQRERTECLIAGIVEQVFEETTPEQYKILTFSAFPNTHISLLQNMDEDHKKQMICQEDFRDFTGWWSRNVTKLISDNVEDEISLNKHETVKEILLAIWCTDKNKCDELKCSLGRCVKEIDAELRKGNITFSSKNRVPNPNVIKAIDVKAANLSNGLNIFRDIIGIQNLTLEQVNAFNSEQNFLFINGPAGSGKTVIVLAKIIQLIKSLKPNEKNEVVLLIYGKVKNTSCYVDALEKADISYSVTWWSEDLDKSLEYLALRKTLLIIEMPVIGAFNISQFESVFQRLKRSAKRNPRHIFVDDFQCALYNLEYNLEGFESLLSKPKALLSTTLRDTPGTSPIWITCDLTQINWIFKFRNNDNISRKGSSFIEEVPPQSLESLSLNLRNTFDIAAILSKIRKTLSEKYRNVIYPPLKAGHFIHGPQTAVHVLEKEVEFTDMTLINRIVNRELDKRCEIGFSGGLKVGAVESYSMMSSPVLKEVIKTRVSNDLIEYCHSKSCNSTEFPAVLVVHDAYEGGMESLYLEISRARVYCALILYSSSNMELNNLSGSRNISNVLRELGADDSVKIILYDS